MLAWLTDPQIWASLITLTAMEIVLGIDNVVFISLVVSRLNENLKKGARQFGLFLALVFRVVMLFGITWIMTMQRPVFVLFGNGFSWRDLILIAGGLFLLFKATQEIHSDIEESGNDGRFSPGATLMGAVAQIAVIDLVFSIDSIVTAVGMADHVEVMIAAVMISMIVMYVAAGAISSFIERHPTTKMLALSFLFMIGAALVADGFGFHIPRGYIYFAMAFSALVELFNILARRRRDAAATKHKP